MKRVLRLSLILMICVFGAFLVACGNNNKGSNNGGKIDINSDKVRIDVLGIYQYTGEQIRPEPNNVRVYVGESYYNSVLYTYEYGENINVGEGTITVTATEENKYVTGTRTVTFEIIPGYGQITVTTLEEMEAELNTYLHQVIRMNNNLEIPVGHTLTIPKDKHLYLSSSFGEFINNGTIIMEEDSFLGIGARYEWNKFINNGTIVCHGDITLYGATFYNSGTVTLDKPVDNTPGGKVYTNSEMEVENKDAQYVLRVKLDESNVTLDTADGVWRYTQEEGGKVPVFAGETKATEYNKFDLIYTGEDAIGEASVKITAQYDNEKYYGTYTKSYNVAKGAITVRTAEAFLEAKDTGKYSEYVITDDITINTDLTIGEDETITSKQLYLKGNVVNNGKITFIEDDRNLYYNVSFSGTTINNGMIQSDNERRYVYISGNFTNNGTIDINRVEVGYSGLFTNNSSVNCKLVLMSTYNGNKSKIVNASIAHMTVSGNIMCHGIIDNAGTLTTNSIDIWGEYCNSGVTSIASATCGSKSYEYRLENKTTGTITLNGTTTLPGVNIVNSGTIINKSIMDLEDSFTAFTLGTWNNADGEVWAYDGMLDCGITDHLYIRRRLSDALDEGVLLLEDTSDLTYTYDKTPHKPTYFTIDGQTLDPEDYTLTCDGYVSGIKDSNNRYDTTFSNAGTIRVTVKIKNTQNTYGTYHYGGECSMTYKIDYGSIEVSDFISFATAVSNKNYDEITLTGDVEYTGSSYTLDEHQTIHTNGNRLKIEGRWNSFTNYGTIVLDEIPNAESVEDACALQVVGDKTSNYATYLYNLGEIVNNSIIYVNEQKGILTNKNKNNVLLGSITGSGEMYTYLDNGVEGTTCTVYNRHIIAQSLVNIGDYVHDYDGTEKRPDITLTGYDISNYDVEFENNVNAGNASVKVIAKPFNQYHIGGVTENFTIDRITKVINMSQIFKSTFFDATNYYKYILNTNVVLTENVVIPDNVALDMGAYRIYNDPNKNYTVTLGNDCDIYVEVNNYDDLQEYVYIATKITVTADIASTSNLNYNLSDSMNPSALFVNEDPYNVEIDLNGHSLDCTVSIYSTTDNAANFKLHCGNSHIKPTVKAITTGGNYTSSRTAHKNLILDNLRCSLGLSINERSVVNIIATNCDFKKLNSYENNYVLATFEDCTFTESTGVYVCGGDISFTDCTINCGTDDALRVYAATSAGVRVSVRGGTITSTATSSSKGYGIKVSRYSAACLPQVSITGTTISGTKGQINDSTFVTIS